MIWSVSTLLRRSGTPTPVWVVLFRLVVLLRGFGGSDLHRDARVQRDQRGAVELRHVEVGERGVVGGEVGDRGQRAPDRGRGGDERGHQVGAATLALATLEVAVRGRGGPLPRRRLVGVDAQARRVPGGARLRAELAGRADRALGLR